MESRTLSTNSEDEASTSKCFPIEIFGCCPSAVRVLIPATWMKIQDWTHLILVVGTIACTVEILRTLWKLFNAQCLATGCVKEILSLVFITPCIWYILTIIGQYDDRLQAKQRAAKVEKENLARSYNDLLSDMDGLLSKSAESSAGLAERTFESKRRDFQRFLERVKERYKVFAGTKDAEQVLRQFKRFCSNWLKVFEECSIDPIHYPKKVINEKDLDDCSSIGEVADLCLDRLKKTEVRFISTQRDQDAQLLRKNKNEFRRMTEKERASRLLELPAPSTSSRSVGQSSSGKKRRLSWLSLGGPRQFYVRSSPTKDSYPKEIRCGCGQLVILSMEHARLLIGVFIGAALFAYNIYLLVEASKDPKKSSTFLILSTTDLLAAEICLIVMLMRFEELDIIQQLEREVKELARQNEQVEKQREKMTEFWSNAQQLTELWLYRTVPRLDLYKEVHNQLEDCSKEDLLTHMAGANQQLEDLERHLGELQDWKQDGRISADTKKLVGKAINEISKENELDKMLEKLEDAVSSKMKALKGPSQ
ncbi:UBA domain-containing protein [Durusdinium trenchii]|uniref:UBA domain-containing protein n=1 Tax=Durusdinium trenchii TaxID=1381693 RepID=A0ABP0MVQ4_9DINO